ncbi:MAG TPA: tyrosinase family protein [Thermomicrobiales bacterium]|nr:tyrosinase family protein [Thermomicrobiales bacterium]
MRYSSIMDRSLSRNRLMRLVAAGAVAVPALHAAGGAAQDATPVASPIASPVASPVSGELAVRRNAKSLSAAEKKAFTDAVLAIKAAPSPWDADYSIYDQFVVWHRDAFACDLMAAHMGPAFFPWHRMFLKLFEEQLQAIDPSVTVPYWDWTVDDTVDSYVWQDDFMGGSGDPEHQWAVMDGPFRKDNWEISIFDEADDELLPFLIRNLGDGKLAPDLPTAEQVETSLALTTYDTAPWNEMSDPAVSFRSYMEGWRDCVPDSCVDDPSDHPQCPGSHDMHNRVHLWVSGEMIFAHEGGFEEVAGPYGTMAMNSSPNDPVFFLHHANVDRLWNQWMQRHGQIYAPASGAMYGHNLDDLMWPYRDIGIQVSPAMMLDSRALGYVYDTD